MFPAIYLRRRKEDRPGMWVPSPQPDVPRGSSPTDQNASHKSHTVRKTSRLGNLALQIPEPCPFLPTQPRIWQRGQRPSHGKLFVNKQEAARYEGPTGKSTLPSSFIPLKQLIKGQDSTLMARLIHPSPDDLGPLLGAVPIHQKHILADPLASPSTLLGGDPREHFSHVQFHQSFPDPDILKERKIKAVG